MGGQIRFFSSVYQIIYIVCKQHFLHFKNMILKRLHLKSGQVHLASYSPVSVAKDSLQKEIGGIIFCSSYEACFFLLILCSNLNAKQGNQNRNLERMQRFHYATKIKNTFFLNEFTHTRTHMHIEYNTTHRFIYAYIGQMDKVLNDSASHENICV